jgi:hypothetical protein
MTTRTIDGSDALDLLRTYADGWSCRIADGSIPICAWSTLGFEIPPLTAGLAADVRSHLTRMVGWIESAVVACESGLFTHMRTSWAAAAHAHWTTVHGALLATFVS